MLNLIKMVDRIKLVLPVLMGKYLIINKDKSTVLVNAGNYNKDEVKEIATVFFKSAYNLR